MEEVLTVDWTLVGVALIAVIEVIFSLVPTSQNWSLLDNIYKLLRLVVPNRAQDGESHKP